MIAIICMMTLDANAVKKKEKMDYSEDFIAEWKEVQALENEGQTKSALAKVENILKAAKETANDPQIIKSLLHQYKYWMTLEEESEIKVVNDLKTEIDERFGNTKYILQSLLAEIYWQYYQNNRHQFLERTTLESVSNDDFRFWDINTLLDKVTTLYLNSIKDIESLSKESIEAYAEIVLKGQETKDLRPTLYDLLAHRVIDFFFMNETGLIDWREPFDLNGKKYFSRGKDFVKIELPDTKVPYPSLGVMRTFQSLTQFRLKDDNAAALVDVELKRLSYAYENARYENKGEDYVDALEGLKKENVNHESQAEVIYYLASYYNKKPDRQSVDLKKSLSLCNEAIDKYGNSYGCIAMQAIEEPIT